MAADAKQPAKFAIAIHGGAGAINRVDLSDALEREYRDALASALRAGLESLCGGRSSVDAVTQAIVVMEDSHLFNAGHGAVLNHEGNVELDAALMEGRERGAGAIAQATRTKNPILLARAVMESSAHVMLAGPGADDFARASHLTTMPNSYFHTKRRRRQLAQAIARGNSPLDHDRENSPLDHDRYGTVGAVAVDSRGNLAAGTSTGGITNKHYGRVGDSPIIGAGTYADNRSCAVSATGQGEHFIRCVIAHVVAQRMLLLGESVTRAAEHAINDELTTLGGRGGLIAMDAAGAIAMPFNTEGMYRGRADHTGRIEIDIFR